MNTAVIRRIAVVGPECSGKTTAVGAIADWLRAAGQVVAVVPEAGRIYAEALPIDHVWTMADEVEVARLHLRLVADALAELSGAGYVVSDGTALTPRVWALRAFGEESPELAALDDTGDADLIFLAKPDLPWHPDPLRTSPENRPIEYAIYLDLLAKSGRAFTTLEGHGPARLTAAHQSLQTMIASKAVV
jgi:nicotinamide riboside kinase